MINLKYLAVGSIGFGTWVRLSQYFSNRSLWSDEAMLALNIVDRSYLELLQPLDYNQAAPPLFLWIEKSAVAWFGNNEYALRLFPLMTGLASLGAFYHLANRYASPLAAPIAIALFACLRYPLYYATEVKQYASDSLAALLVYLLLLPLADQQLDRRQQVGLGLVGTTLIWLSHSSLLVLAGVEMGHWLGAAQRRRILINRWPIYGVWLVSFIGLYWLTIRGTLTNDYLVSSWRDQYPDALLDLSWLVDTVGRFFQNPLGFVGLAHEVAIAAFILGCIAYARRPRSMLLGLTGPLLTTLLAAYLGQYPFRDRLVLFLVPPALLLIAEGIAYLFTQAQQWTGGAAQSDQRSSRLSPTAASSHPAAIADPSFGAGLSPLLLHWRRLRPQTPVLVLGMFVAVLLVPPMLQASRLLVQPTQVEEIRPALAYIRAHQTPGDRLYVYRCSNQFTYYAAKFNYTQNDYVMGKSIMVPGSRGEPELSPARLQRLQREIGRWRGQPRVWFLLCKASAAEERAFLSIAEPLGQQLDRFQQPQAVVYLYRFE